MPEIQLQEVQLEQSLTNSTKAKQNKIIKPCPFVAYIAVSNTILTPQGSHFYVTTACYQKVCKCLLLFLTCSLSSYL